MRKARPFTGSGFSVPKQGEESGCRSRNRQGLVQFWVFSSSAAAILAWADSLLARASLSVATPKSEGAASSAPAICA